ncbi:hypothetical protein BACCAP_04222 [Pseudoflavonifractor capillosus ATCC 29799]|uniref:Uncharacterized protein n=1 Tax=Pseudoflavonifractor capillosus ATCC 29799 TaxID=411467 RepID=A6P154_9FIRM|nr:hypothetical protein BACCAP_04222 [Pseudoflavonifractor capillosus ATCC 29799]
MILRLSTCLDTFTAIPPPVFPALFFQREKHRESRKITPGKNLFCFPIFLLSSGGLCII